MGPKGAAAGPSRKPNPLKLSGDAPQLVRTGESNLDCCLRVRVPSLTCIPCWDCLNDTAMSLLGSRQVKGVCLAGS